MALRVTMVEVTEILRLWLMGVWKKRIAQHLGFDVKTVRRHLAIAKAHGLDQAHGLAVLDDEFAQPSPRRRSRARAAHAVRGGLSARRTAGSSSSTSSKTCDSPRSASCPCGRASRSSTSCCAVWRLTAQF